MNKAKTTNRRNFLLSAGLGAGVAASVVTAGKAVKTAAAETPAAPQPDGYRETDHIRKYYKTTKV